MASAKSAAANLGHPAQRNYGSIFLALSNVTILYCYIMRAKCQAVASFLWYAGAYNLKVVTVDCGFAD
ncbi:predicted protein [Plenodomus lingam JN3]|uniref:Predicted protein n=1 Tax=Leptosphaeria maculans (strain JN3 / isolate v23.1.3 / race Av1-4-5-6-7-8) TaxID=985895 RepID=E4ZP53_LEPMJ|nr:predicted protein [Plenodomus lingam JN3]CBX93582.1 predicted protein [Plenodomus lingam JN3]